MSDVSEATYEQAVTWWPDIRRQLSYLSWKDHYWKFTHLWSGGLIVSEVGRTMADRPIVDRHKDRFCQIAIGWSTEPDAPAIFKGYYPGEDLACDGGTLQPQSGQWQCPMDDGSTPQRLVRGYLPIVETDHAVGGGARVRQTSFATVLPGASIRTGQEPLFAILHFEVIRSKKGRTAHLWLQFAPLHFSCGMTCGMRFRYPVAPLPQPTCFRFGMGLYVGKRVYLATMLGEDAGADFISEIPSEAPGWEANRVLGYDHNLMRFPMPLEKGQALTLIVPFCGCSATQIRPLLREGYVGALARVTATWERETSRGARITTPDPEVNRFYRFNLALSAIQAEIRPELGSRIIETSINHYEAYWATPGSFTFGEFAQRGLFKDVSEWIEHFRRDQGRNTPPGEHYPFAEGFLTSPAEYAPIPMRWLTDHGAIMWAACETYLLSRDSQFLRSWLPVIRKACWWIAESRRFDGRGILPPGRASDASEHAYHPWTDAWNYRGLLAAIRLFEAIGHKDEARRWEKEAQAWRTAFRRSLVESIAAYPSWKAPNGDDVPFVPGRLKRFVPLKPENEAAAREDYQQQITHGFYMDCGPLASVAMGLLDPDDEIVAWAFRFLLEGPSQATYRDTGHPRMCFQSPVLHHEMSSCEPCYSWNVPARLLRDEIPQFLEGFYSILAGAQPRKTLGLQETRHGIHGCSCAGGFLLLLLRRMLVWEHSTHELRLLEAIPRRWLGPGQRIELIDLPTYFGPLSLRSHGAKESVRFEMDLPQRNPPRSMLLRLRLPDAAKPSLVRINGRKAAVVQGRVRLHGKPAHQVVEVSYRT